MRCRRSLRINSSKDWCNAPPKDLVRRFGYCPFRKFHPSKIKQIAKLTTAVVLAAIAIVLCAYAFYNGHNQLPKIILGIKFSDGIEVVRSQAQTAAA